MKMLTKKLSILFGTMVLVGLLAGCSDGPAEEAGEDVDNLIEQAEGKLNVSGNAIEDACERVKEEANTEDQDC